ncbi:hypothetical protein BDK51DRAFT_42504, partial [Blyttiomyces helicus]
TAVVVVPVVVVVTIVVVAPVVVVVIAVVVAIEVPVVAVTFEVVAVDVDFDDADAVGGDGGAHNAKGGGKGEEEDDTHIIGVVWGPETQTLVRHGPQGWGGNYSNTRVKEMRQFPSGSWQHAIAAAQATSAPCLGGFKSRLPSGVTLQPVLTDADWADRVSIEQILFRSSSDQCRRLDIALRYLAHTRGSDFNVVARFDGGLIGFINMRYARGVAYLQGAGVVKEWRLKGVMRAMLERAVVQAKERGFEVIFTRAFDEPARKAEPPGAFGRPELLRRRATRTAGTSPRVAREGGSLDRRPTCALELNDGLTVVVGRRQQLCFGKRNLSMCWNRHSDQTSVDARNATVEDETPFKNQLSNSPVH